MIFATVGTQLPFDRLLLALDVWADRNKHVPILAQTGGTTQKFEAIRTVTKLDMVEFDAQFAKAKLIVAHAGMGTILSAAELGKPVLLMPRQSRFNEHRNDHQLDTAREMSRLTNVTVVHDDTALHDALDRALASGFSCSMSDVCTDPEMLSPLIGEIRDFVWADQYAAAPVRAQTKTVA